MPVPFVGDTTHEREVGMEDDVAAAALLEREEELRVGARALTRRLKHLETQAADLRGEIDSNLSRRWKALDHLEDLQENIRLVRWGLYELTANAIGTDHNAADVALWCERALEMGATHPRLDQDLLMDLVHVRKVPNESFRARYIHLTARNDDIKQPITRQVYLNLVRIEGERGEKYGSASLMVGNKPQARTIERWLGVQTTPGPSTSPPTLRLFVRYEQAEALALTFDMAPHQAGI
jgi:hypothetical protein